MKYLLFPSLILIVTAAVVFRSGTSPAAHSAGASGMPISHEVPAEYLVPFSAFDLRFVESSVATGAPPILPDGTSGITDQEAVVRAMETGPGAAAGQPSASIMVAARYGIFSDDVYAKGGNGAPTQLLYQNRPVWIVTLFGPNVVIPMNGPAGQKVHHEQNIVIDAATGEYLEGFS